MIHKLNILLFTVLFSITGFPSYSQNAGIGTNTPQHKLDVNGEMRIRKNGIYNSGISFQNSNGIMNSTLGNYNGASSGYTGDFFGFYSAQNNPALLFNTENGRASIGVVNPESKLDIAGTIRLKHNGSTAGLWLEGTTGINRSFIGVVNDTTLGFWGNGGAGWNFTHIINSGYTGIGLGTSVPPTTHLDVNGSLRLRLPNVQKGSILASADADGNLKWQNTIAFRTDGLLNGADVLFPSGVIAKMIFSNTPTYNYGGGYQPATSVFIAPETGIYQFKTQYTPVGGNNITINYYTELFISKESGGDTTIVTYDKTTYVKAHTGLILENANPAQVSSGSIKLLAGDKIWVEVRAYSTLPYSGSPVYTWFAGEMISRL
jgi:hypothetical protein